MSSYRRPKVTSHTVAQRAGVSRTTVSFVLNGREQGIPEETRERVLRAAAELGYVPSAAATAIDDPRRPHAVVRTHPTELVVRSSCGHGPLAPAARRVP